MITKRALAIYQLAESRQDGKIAKTYSALYRCHPKLGRAPRRAGLHPPESISAWRI